MGRVEIEEEKVILENEWFPERDLALRNVGQAVLTGAVVSVSLAEQFFASVAQIAARAALKKEISGELIDEVVADTELRVWGAMKNGKCIPGPAPMAAYVSVVAGRTAINMSKRQAVRRRRETSFRDESRSVRGEKWPPERPVEDEVALRLALEQVVQAISRLPDSQRVIVKLLPTHSHAEICSRLGITDSALRNRLLRARQQLHKDCPNLLD